MQVSRPINFYLPEKLLVELEKYIDKNPPSWKYDMNLFYHLIHRLIVMQNQIKDKDSNYFPLRTDNLKYVSNWNLIRYKKYLLNGEFLDCDYTAITGKKKYHYRLNPTYLQGSRKVEIQSGSSLYRSIIHQQRLTRSHSNRMLPYLKRMQDFYLDVDMDYSEAKKYADSHPDEAKKHSYLTSIAMIEDKRFRRFSRNKTNNRLDTNFTNLKSDFRQFLIGDFVSIDLANSQPFLLSQLLGEIFTTITTNTIPRVYSCSILDFDLVKEFGKQTFNNLLKTHQNEVFLDFGELLNFQISCINGTFYEDFLDQIKSESNTRGQIKKMLFAVLFSQNLMHKDFIKFIPYQKEKTLFASVYPSIYHVIKALKDEDHSKLAVLLQKIEAQVFIDTICRDLVKQGITPLTIHDSIIVESNHTERALCVCDNTFKKHFGVMPKFHVKPLNQS